MPAARRGEPPTTRTVLASIAAIAVAIGAGAFALAANLGWLSSSAGARVGTLSSAQDLASAPADAAEPATAAGRSFAVGEAGRVVVTSTAGNLVLASVHAERGWTWQVLPGPESQLDVSFTNGSRTVVLRAAAATDGSVAAVVHEGPETAATTSVSHRAPAEPEREGHGEDD